MKKVIALMLTLALSASMLVACGEKPAPAPAPTEAPKATEAPAEKPATDAVKDAATGYFLNFPEDRHMIGVKDLFAKIDAGEEMVILDVRQPDAYAEGHLKGAYNVPLGADVAKALEAIPDDAAVFVNCYTGQTSSQVVALLNIAGKHVTNIQGGYKNGIATTEGFEKYIDKTACTLPTETYPVDDAIEAAIAKYFDDMAASSFKYFNFPADKLLELVQAESEDYTILSVRKAEDFAKGHIAGAINIPFGKGMQEKFSEIPAGKPVIVYCYTGQTSSQTTATLRMLGYEAYSLAGGMGKEGGAGWLGAKGPVVTE
ncbi:MAG: rhodanese-like domain-containing protein [Oscillospiraceae bacterium]